MSQITAEPSDSHPLAGADSDNPWLGLASFTEDLRSYFFGRDEETAALLRLVRREALTILFGQSGLGKTSLLQAGLFPQLREADCFPVYIRLDYLPHAAPLSRQVLAAVESQAAAAHVEIRPPRPGETLWEYFHRRDADFWLPSSRLATPVLVFDQFEELFTLGRADQQARERSESFIGELADLIENRVPAAIRARLDGEDDGGAAFDFRRVSYKLVISLREDYLADLDDLKSRIRSISQNRMRIVPMSGTQALSVVVGAGRDLVDADVAMRIVQFVAASSRAAANADAGPAAGAPPTGLPQPASDQAVVLEQLAALHVEPSLLSVVCRELNGRRQRRGLPRITSELLVGNRREILSDFYERTVRGMDPRVRSFIEDRLLTRSGFRNSVAIEDALAEPGVTQSAIDTLVSRRLLRMEERSRQHRIELTHDLLIEPVRMSRDKRHRERELENLHQREGRSRRRKLFFAGSAVVVIAAIVVALWQIQHMAELNREKSIAQQERQRAQTEENRAEHRTTELAAGTMLDHGRQAFKVGHYDQAAVFLAAAARLYPDILATHGATGRYQLVQSLEEARASATSAHVAGSSGAESPLRLGPLVTALSDHKGPVDVMAVDPAAPRMITGGHDGTAILWDTENWRRLATLNHSPGSAWITAVDFSGDGKLVATAGGNALRVWDVTTGRMKAEYKDPHFRITGVCFASDDHRLLIARHSASIVAPNMPARPIFVYDLDAGTTQEGEPFSPDTSMLVPSPDRRYVLGIGDGNAGVWRTASPDRLCALGSSTIDCGAFGPDGLSFAIGHSDGTSEVWDITGGRRCYLAPADKTAGGVKAVRFDPAGQQVALAGADGYIRLCNASSGDVMTKIYAAGQPSRLAFSPDGSLLLAADMSGMLAVWDAVTGDPVIQSWKAHNGDIRDLAFLPGGRFAVSSSTDGTVKVWRMPVTNLSPGALADQALTVDSIKQIGHHYAEITDPDLRQAIDLLAIHSTTPNQLFQEVRVAAQQGRYLVAAAMSADAYLAAGGPAAPDPVRLLTADLLRRFAPLRWATQAHQRRIECVGFSPDSARVVSASWDGTSRLMEAASGRTIAILHSSGITYGLRFSPENSTVLTFGDRPDAELFDARTGAPRSILHHGARVVAAGYTPDGREIWTADRNGTAFLWSATDGAPLAKFNAATPDHRISSVAPVSEGRSLLVQTNTALALWNAQSFASLGPLATTDDGLAQGSATAVSPDGRLVAAEYADHTVTVFDVAQRKPIFTLTGHTADINTLGFDAAGTHLVSAGEDGTACIWDLNIPPPATGSAAAAPAPLSLQPAAILQHPESDVLSAQLDARASRVMTLCGGAARVWDAHTGALLATFDANTGVWLSAAMSPDGASVATGSNEGLLQLWNVPAAGSEAPMRCITPAVLSSVDLAPDASWAVLTDGKSVSMLVQPTAAGERPAPREILQEPFPILRVACIPDPERHRFALVLGGAQATVVDLAAAKPLRSVSAGARGVEAILNKVTGTANPLRAHFISTAISGDRTWLATADDAGIHLFHLPDLAPVQVTGFPREPTLRLMFDSSSRCLIAANDAGTIQVWECGTGRSLASVGPAAPSPVYAVDIVPSVPGNALAKLTIAAAGQDQVIRLWQTAAADSAPASTQAGSAPATQTVIPASHVIGEFSGHTASITSLAVSSDAARLLSVSDDGTVKLWSVSDRALLHSYGEQFDAAERGWFSPDGALAFVAFHSGEIRILDAGSGDVVKVLRAHLGGLTAASPGADGSRLLSAGTDRTLELWNLSLENRPAAGVQEDVAAIKRKAQGVPLTNPSALPESPVPSH